MPRPTADTPDATFVETPMGLFTVEGVWFHTTEERLRAYAAPVVEREGLGPLLALASAWLGSPRTLTLWLLPVALLGGPVLGSIAAAGFFLAWSVLSPAAVPPWAARLVRRMDSIPLQAIYYVVVLSWMAGQGATGATVAGLVGFIGLRWGVFDRLARPLVEALHRRLFPLPAADAVLRSLVVRLAIQGGTPPPDVARMEEDILSAMRRRGS